jgi:preprotein translocase subunit Sss1
MEFLLGFASAAGLVLIAVVGMVVYIAWRVTR